MLDALPNNCWAIPCFNFLFCNLYSFSSLALVSKIADHCSFLLTFICIVVLRSLNLSLESGSSKRSRERSLFPVTMVMFLREILPSLCHQTAPPSPSWKPWISLSPNLEIVCSSAIMVTVHQCEYWWVFMSARHYLHLWTFVTVRAVSSEMPSLIPQCQLSNRTRMKDEEKLPFSSFPLLTDRFLGWSQCVFWAERSVSYQCSIVNIRILYGETMSYSFWTNKSLYFLTSVLKWS